MTTTALSTTYKPAGVIETHHTDAATEWGYSFTSHNPEPDDYIRCASEADAWKLDRHIRRIESALASAEPVAYEERMRPVWDERAPWTPWERCSRESYENCVSKPKPWISNDWEIQRRSLYTHAQPAAKVEAARFETSPEDRFEQFVQAEIARSPKPLQELGEYLTRVLDEDEFPTANRLLLQLAVEYSTPASVPDGYVIAPHFRGFADLGLGRYRMFHSRAGVEAELCIVPATPEEAAGRVVGDLRYDGPDEIPAELMAVRLRFENVAGLDALEQQLRLLRETHFLTPPTNQEGAAP